MDEEFLEYMRKNGSSLEKELRPVFKKYGLSAKYTSGKFDVSSGEMKFLVSWDKKTGSESGSCPASAMPVPEGRDIDKVVDPTIARLRDGWRRYAVFNNLDPEWLGKSFVYGDREFSIIGYDPKKRSRRIWTYSNGKYYRFDPAEIRNLMSRFSQSA